MAVRQISYAIRDADDNTSSHVIRFPAGAETLAQITAYAQAMSLLLDELTEGQIVSITMSASIALQGGEKASPVAKSNDQEGGLFGFGCTGTEYRYGLRIPAFDQTKFVKDVINLSDSEVLEWTSALKNGLGAGGFTFHGCDEKGFDISSVISGVKSFRRK